MTTGERLDGVGSGEHEVTKEYRIFGPPGTGKSTSVARQCRRAVAKYGENGVMLTSFSKTAAKELATAAEREFSEQGLYPIPDDRIGTLHSFAFRALGRPTIAEANVEQWNIDNPSARITPLKQQKMDGEEGKDEFSSDTKAGGDQYLEAISRYRGVMLNPNYWPLQYRQFNEKWTEYKEANDLLDFTDLIERAYKDVWAAPGSPEVIFADEAQDLNKLQMALIRAWGSRAQYFIVAGDDDQLIYQFCGATPEAMLEPEIPKEQVIILKQSFRVPRAVHALADSYIRQVGRRQEKEYLPRDSDGSVIRLRGGSWQNPSNDLFKTALDDMDKGHTVMFLAACSYQLQPLVKALRERGIPFHNPYRKTNGYWNPIRYGSATSAGSRVLALLSALRTGEPWPMTDFALWAEWMASKGVLKHGAKKRLEDARPDQFATLEVLDTYLEPATLEGLVQAFNGDKDTLLKWWKSLLSDGFAKRVEFPARCVSVYGEDALTEEPRIVVGTIHSVKGGQADSVFLFPDLSASGIAEYKRSGATRDSITRQFYVGMTRAREVLYICDQATPAAVSI